MELRDIKSDHRSDFADRLIDALKDYGQARHGAGAFLHKLTGVTTKGANKWLNGESLPEQPHLVTIANKLNVRSEWLRYGTGYKNAGDEIESQPSRKEAVTDQSKITESNVAPAPSNKEKLYPVISWVHAGAWAEAVDLYQPGCADQWETTDSNVSDRSFWLKVVGDSMTALSGPSIPEGHLILVDPDATPINGSLVIAKLTDHQEVTFKKLVIDADHKYLKPLNPNYETTKINGNCQIVGVVKEAKIKF